MGLIGGTMFGPLHMKRIVSVTTAVVGTADTASYSLVWPTPFVCHGILMSISSAATGGGDDHWPLFSFKYSADGQGIANGQASTSLNLLKDLYGVHTANPGPSLIWIPAVADRRFAVCCKGDNTTCLVRSASSSTIWPVANWMGGQQDIRSLVPDGASPAGANPSTMYLSCNVEQGTSGTQATGTVTGLRVYGVFTETLNNEGLPAYKYYDAAGGKNALVAIDDAASKALWGGDIGERLFGLSIEP